MIEITTFSPTYFGTLAQLLVDARGKNAAPFGTTYNDDRMAIRLSSDRTVLEVDQKRIASNVPSGVCFRSERDGKTVLAHEHRTLASHLEWQAGSVLEACLPDHRTSPEGIAFRFGYADGPDMIRYVVVEATDYREAVETLRANVTGASEKIVEIISSPVSTNGVDRSGNYPRYSGKRLIDRRVKHAQIEEAKKSTDIVVWFLFRDSRDAADSKPYETLPVRAVDINDAWETITRDRPLATLHMVEAKVQTLAEFVEKPLRHYIASGPTRTYEGPLISRGLKEREAAAQAAIVAASEREAVQRGLDDMRAGRIATDQQVEAAYDRFRDPEYLAMMLPPLDAIERANGTTYTLSEAAMEGAIKSVLDRFIDNPEDGEGEPIKTAFDLSCHIVQPLLEALKAAGRR